MKKISISRESRITGLLLAGLVVTACGGGGGGENVTSGANTPPETVASVTPVSSAPPITLATQATPATQVTPLTAAATATPVTPAPVVTPPAPVLPPAPAAPVSIVTTLPAEPAIKMGDMLSVPSASGNDWQLVQAAGQTIGTRKLGGTEPGLDASWIQQNEPIRNWWFVASSASGRKLAAVANSNKDIFVPESLSNEGYIYTSADAGVTWTEHREAGSRGWASIASSADGTKLAAASVANTIWTSDDSGSTWKSHPESGEHFWVSITMSSDGSRLTAVALEEGNNQGDGKIYTWAQSAGNAFGAGAWTARMQPYNWRSIASSGDGSKLVAVAYSDFVDTPQPIYLSFDFGATWVPSTGIPVQPDPHTFYRVASSQDGKKLAAAERYGKIYTSSDSGLTWVAREPDGGFNSMAMSSDGNTVVAVQQLLDNPLVTGKIYISTDGGATWAQRQQARKWRGVALSADGNRIAAAVLNGSMYTSTSNRTTLGTAGSIAGGPANELQLRYLGDGLFDVTSASGPAFAVK
jgi:BNR/Asp-box repeat